MPVAGAAVGVAAPLFVNRWIDGATSEDLLRMGARAGGGVVGLGVAVDGLQRYAPGDAESLTKAFLGAAILGEETLEFFTLPLTALGGKSIYQATLDWFAGLLPPAQQEALKKAMSDGFRFPGFGFGPIVTGSPPGKTSTLGPGAAAYNATMPQNFAESTVPKDRKAPGAPPGPKTNTEIVKLMGVARSIIPKG